MVGAGVVGLSCAVRLLEAGHRVDVVARDLPLETTSVVAAALWYPYRALPQDRVTAWARRSYAVFGELAAEETGVRLLEGTEAHSATAPDPWWVTAVPQLRRVPPPEGYADAWSFTAPVVDMPVYLRWLRSRVAALGGTVTRMSLHDLPGTQEDVVVNCSGIGSRLLAGDHEVFPVRGQVVLLDGIELDRWFLDASGPTYVVPRTTTVVVGGTDDEGEWSRTPSAATAEELLRRGRALVPELDGARIVAHRVGLRPARPVVRLEAEGRVVHCYGHGGAGVTLSWGCAEEVAELVSPLAS